MHYEHLKSAVIIDDPDEIAERLKARGFKNGRVSKATSSLASQGAPSVPNEEGLQSLASKRGIPWEESYASRVIPYWASDERVDGHGDIVKQNWSFDEYESNPVLAFSHNWDDLPVGNALDWQIVKRKSESYTGPALWMLALFSTKEQREFADTVFRMAKSGFLRGGSVGFWSGKMIDVTDSDERQKLGLGERGFILDENHLLEFSPTLMGANQGAMSILANAKKQKLLVADDFTVIRELCRQQCDRDEWKETDNNFRSLARTLFPKHEFPLHDDIDEPFVQRSLPDMVSVASDDSDLSSKMDRILSMMEEVMQGQSVIMNDIRDTVEEIRNAVLRRDTREDDDSVDDERVSRFLGLIDSIREEGAA